MGDETGRAAAKQQAASPTVQSQGPAVDPKPGAWDPEWLKTVANRQIDSELAIGAPPKPKPAPQTIVLPAPADAITEEPDPISHGMLGAAPLAGTYEIEIDGWGRLDGAMLHLEDLTADQIRFKNGQAPDIVFGYAYPFLTKHFKSIGTLTLEARTELHADLANLRGGNVFDADAQVAATMEGDIGSHGYYSTELVGGVGLAGKPYAESTSEIGFKVPLRGSIELRVGTGLKGTTESDGLVGSSVGKEGGMNWMWSPLKISVLF